MSDRKSEAMDGSVSRRGFIHAAAVGTVVAATAGAVSAQEAEEEPENGEAEDDVENDEDDAGPTGDVEPDWGGWLDDAPNYTRTQDLRGETEVEVAVGTGPEGVEYEPPAIWIDPGTTVVWEWTGEGGAHDVTTEEGPADLNSDLTDEAGFTYEFTFEEEHEGITTYYCSPHIGVGMLGGVAVGDDVPTVAVEDVAADGVGGVPLPDTAQTIGVATGLAMLATLGIAYVFMKYGGQVERTDG